MTLIIEAGSGLKTFLFLCRFRYDSPLGPVVAFRGDYCIRFRDLLCALAVLVQFIALAAGPIFDVAGFGTCRIYRFRLLKRMALCRYYCICCCGLCCSLIITKQLFALAAGPVLGVAGLGAVVISCVPSLSLYSLLHLLQVQYSMFPASVHVASTASVFSRE